MISHLKKKKESLIKIVKPKKNDLILDIGSNDGTLLNLYTNKFKRYGVDPTAKKFKKYYQKGHKNLPKIFKKNIFSQKIKFKIITAMPCSMI